MEYVHIAVRCMVALVFAASLWGKFTSSGLKELVASTRRLAPSRLTRFTIPLSFAVLVGQSLIVVSMVTPFYSYGLGFAVMFLGVFAFVLFRAVRRGDTAACACFISDTSDLSYVQVLRNLILIVVTAVGFVSLPVQSSGNLDPMLVVVTLGIALIATVIFFRLPDFASAFRWKMREANK